MTNHLRRLAVLLIVLMLGLAGSPALADHEGGEGHGTTAKGGEHGGKPDVKGAFFGKYPAPLGIHTLIVFVLLLFILGRFAWPKIMEGLDKREQSIKGAFDDADKARAEAQKLLAEVQAERAKGNDEIRAMLEEARRDAQVLKDKTKEEAAKEIQAERERLRREIDIARDQAMQEISSQAVQLATLVSSRAIRRELSTDDHRRLVDEALVDLKQNVGKA